MPLLRKDTVKTTERKKLKQLSSTEKIQYIWDYYRFHMVIAFIILYIAGYIIYGHVTEKEISLYTALINVSAGETLTEELTGGFLEAQDIDTSKNDCYLYSGLYLTDDETSQYYEYVHASRIKLLAAIDGEKLDVVITDREVFEALTESEYLCDIEDILHSYVQDETILKKADPFLEGDEHTKTGINISDTAIIHKAGFEDDVYLGVIANSAHLNTAAAYIEYLFAD